MRVVLFMFTSTTAINTSVPITSYYLVHFCFTALNNLSYHTHTIRDLGAVFFNLHFQRGLYSSYSKKGFTFSFHQLLHTATGLVFKRGLILSSVLEAQTSFWEGALMKWVWYVRMYRCAVTVLTSQRLEWDSSNSRQFFCSQTTLLLQLQGKISGWLPFQTVTLFYPH